MKASDICIGDWFRAVDFNSPFRITAIYDDLVQTQADYQSEIDGNWYSEAEIKDLVPIELTEDILVKNGFKHQMPYNDYALGELSLYEGGNGYIVNGFVGLGGLTVHCDYVHTLQHLLRLCGIDKEIEL